jgi:hypothetical protein
MAGAMFANALLLDFAILALVLESVHYSDLQHRATLDSKVKTLLDMGA